MLRPLLATCLFGLTALVALPGTDHHAEGPAPKPQKRLALLIGCSNYPDLAERFQLRGPANDVLLMQDLLVKQFHFSQADVVVLSEQQGKDRGEKFLPTRANIEREFKALATKASEGDYVVVFMAGHGSQQPEDPKAPEPEPDGLDEIFLPRDVGKWDDNVGKVKNAIIDDELGDWLKVIQKKKASVWITVDSCHSGSITRGTRKERTRDVKPDEALGVPKKRLQDAIEAARKRAPKGGATTRGGGPVETTPFKLAKAGGLVAVYAAQAHEVTVEFDLPEDAKGARPYGLLTYAITRVLTQARGRGKPITYRDMVYQVHQVYESMGRTAPTPVIEGGDVNREVLGEKKWDATFRIVLQKSDDDWKVSAGALHGLTAGSVLAVFPPTGQGDRPVGHVKVESVTNGEAMVVPCAFEKAPVKSDLPDRGLCKVVSVDMGELRLRVSVDEFDSEKKPQPVPKEWRQRLLAELKKLQKDGSVIEATDDPAAADWLLRKKASAIVLVPAQGKPTVDDDPKNRAFGPVPQDERFGKWLTERLNRIARAQNLRKLAAQFGATEEEGVKVQTELWLAPNVKDKRGSIKLPWPDPGLRFYDGDRLIVRLHNPNKFAIDVTLLAIDSNHKIDVLWPNEEVNRIAAGQTEFAHPIRLKANTTGQEHLVVIAVRGRTREPVDFRGLAQPGLEVSRSTNGQKLGMASAFGKVLDRALYGQGTTRAASREALAELTAELVPYRMMKGKRPPPPK
jgi:hypothetical protein